MRILPKTLGPEKATQSVLRTGATGYQCLQESHRITELDLQSTEAKLEAANQVIEKLISAKQLLEQKLQAVTKGRVTPLRPE